MILYVNACVREGSRTKRLADALISRLGGKTHELRLASISFPEADEAFLKRRDMLIAKKIFDDDLFEYARLFASADAIVIAAPYWDLSFPAKLKQFFEQINVLGVTFEYSPDGFPIGLCRGNKLYYVTTAGGSFVPLEFGFGYVKALAENFYGIKAVELIKADGLDIDGADADGIMEKALRLITETK